MAIPLMWVMQHKLLQKPKSSHPLSTATVSVDTTRHLRSAATNFYEGSMMLSRPESCVYDNNKKGGHLSPGRHPTEHLAFTRMSKGLRRRIGVNPRPSRVLRLEHILWNQNIARRNTGRRASRDYATRQLRHSAWKILPFWDGCAGARRLVSILRTSNTSKDQMVQHIAYSQALASSP